MKRTLTSIVTMALAIMLCLSLYHTEAFAKSKPVKLSKSTATVTVGKSTTLKAKYNGKSVKATKVKWTSSKKAVATVSSKGKVKAKKAGNTVIKATYRRNGKSYTAQCKVTVTAKSHSHEWKKVVDEPAWDEYEEVPVYETKEETRWYMSDGTDVTDWTFAERCAWCDEHCTDCFSNAPDPRYVTKNGKTYAVCAGSLVGETVVTKVQTGTKKVVKKHHKEVSHYECSCGATK